MACKLRVALNVLISLSLALMTPVPVWASGEQRDLKFDPKQMQQLRYDMQLAYWAQLDHEHPEVAALGLGPDPVGPTWKITGDNPLLDADPFFMRAQSWADAGASASDCAQGICYLKSQSGVTLALASQSQALTLNLPFTPVLETREHIFLTADNDSIFRSKAGGESNPGEGVFFIAKKDLLFAGHKKRPVPVFYFPLPDSGWTGVKGAPLELEITDQVILQNHSGFSLAIEKRDISLMEQVGRQNLVLSQTYAFLDGTIAEGGLALPKPQTTLLFGLLLSGQTTATKATGGRRFGGLPQLVLPQAHANENENSDLRAKIQEQIKVRAAQAELLEKEAPRVQEGGYDWAYWKKWLINGVLYGGTGVAAYLAYEPIDFSNMITADMPERIGKVAQILGVVAMASVAMKYSIHKAHFDKLYPKQQQDSWLKKMNQEHKGIMSELAHGLYFSLAVLPQGIRHALEFLKDHFMPSNKTVHKAWDATMGFQMRQNSHLAMNYKTQYLGWLFGLADSVMVAVYLLIFGPFVIKSLGLDINMGHATAAYASAEVLRNFLAYLQSGAHGYSAEVKFIHLKSAENEARAQMRAKGINPDAARNQQELLNLTEAELAKRYKTVGLPGQDEFLYDPITVLEDVTRRAGYSSAYAGQVPNTNFVLKNRRWGLVQPALKKALATARKAFAESPSPAGAQTVNLLEWALKDRAMLPRVAGRVWDAAASKWGADGLRDSIDQEIVDYISRSKSPNSLGASLAYVKGAFKYLALDSTKEVREIREVLYLMSTTGNASDVMAFLPRKWREKAGSDEAAALGAELFHRAFFGFYEHDSQMITPDHLLEAEFGARANALLDRFANKEQALKDPFVRKVRYWELLYRLKKKDMFRSEIVNYQPATMSGKAKKQWELVRAKVMGLWHDERKQEPSDEWLSVAQQYAEISGNEMQDPQAWAKSYRFRLLVAREFAREVGLETDDVGQSSFVRKALIDAAVRTEAQLANRGERRLSKKMSPKDFEFYEAQLFTRNFVDSYVALSVHSDEHLEHDSPQYPGRFQKIRRALVGKPASRLITGVLRGVEAMFRNSETSYRAGWMSLLERNVPLVPDMVYNFMRNLRVMPYLLSISYLTSWYVWQIHTPYALWAFMLLIAFINPTLVEMNNRLQKNYGFKPMGDVPSKLLYGWVHSFLTNPELIAIQGYSQPIVDSFDKHVVKPIKALPENCMDLLTGGKKP